MNDLLAVSTFILAVATIYLAYHTHKLAYLSSLSEEIRLSMEQNWKLWEHRKEVWVPVAPQNLTEDDWRWRLRTLNHFNLLKLAYRRNTFGIGKFFYGEDLKSWVAKSIRAIEQTCKDTVGANQLKQLLQIGEGFDKDFIAWMTENKIISPADYL